MNYQVELLEFFDHLSRYAYLVLCILVSLGHHLSSNGLLDSIGKIPHRPSVKFPQMEEMKAVFPFRMPSSIVLLQIKCSVDILFTLNLVLNFTPGIEEEHLGDIEAALKQSTFTLPIMLPIWQAAINKYHKKRYIN